MRALMPQNTTPATISTASRSKTTTLSVRGRVGGGLGGTLTSIGNSSLLMQHAEHSGHEKQRGDSGADQSADHSAAERGVLFATFAQAHRHGNHPDNHGERGHQNRTKAREAGFQSGAHGIAF